MTTPCPRCRQPYDTATAAASRLTLPRTLPICSPCGTDEAVRDAQGLAPIPPREWPLT
ncbi:hypothetical protein [Streptomyces alboflavus]|uniref:hypothetical protein n=1 Tax=Streptomyces alboflavus TaxID=67267 RepID=UPI001386F42E|nr:hypothetical protein [Streptomyces alboflavus]